MAMDDQTRFVHKASDKKRWNAAAKQWAQSVGLAEGAALSAWIRVVLNQAANEELAGNQANEGKRKGE